MPRDQFSIGGANPGIVPATDTPATAGSPQVHEGLRFDRMRKQVAHASSRLAGLFAPMRRKAPPAFGGWRAELTAEDGRGDSSTLAAFGPLPRASLRMTSLCRGASSSSSSVLSGADSELVDVDPVLSDHDDDAQESEVPLLRRPRTSTPLEASGSEGRAAMDGADGAASLPLSASATDIVWPAGRLPDDVEIRNLVTRFLARLMPHDAQSRQELNPLLRDAIGRMRDEAAGTPPPSAAPSLAPVPGLDQGGADHFDKYQDRAAALQMQAAKMQLVLSVTNAISDLIKAVGAKLESAAARG